MIRNQVTGDSYYGSSVNLGKRQMEHVYALRRGDHGNRRMQFSWNKYGESAFTFAVLAVTERADAVFFEARLLDSQRGNPKCMNASFDPCTVMQGHQSSPATRSKLKASWTDERRGRIFTPEYAEKMRQSLKGRIIRPESSAKRIATLKGRGHDYSYLHSPSARAKASAARMGREVSSETRQRISETKYLRRALRLFAAHYIPPMVAA